jgi:Leucine-rich repeat (LRR) protein
MLWYLNDLNKWIKNGCDNHIALQITELDLSHCELITIPNEISNLINLQKLYLCDSNLTTIPKEIGNLINLHTLCMYNNKLTTIPAEIGNLINLKELYLYNNNLTTIPKEIGNLINLQILDLDTNKLRTMPNKICNLINLQKLYVENNNLTTIPNKICNLINLQRLSLGNNKITKIPEIGNLINLNILNLPDNKLTKIQIKICNLINLQFLNLENNNLTTIPKQIGNLINLQKLYLDKNNLTIIPNEIGNLINLQQLYLGSNSLTTIPTEIGNLINLQTLDLGNNNITTFPIEILNIRNVEVYYSDNPIEYIPPQVIRYLERNKTIQKIYNDNQSVHNHYIQESIKKSINYIMSIKPIYDMENINEIIINNNFINNQTKTILFEYINCQDIHSTLNITFAELLINVISFIDQHEFKNEIYKVLEQEMNDTICKCFTGRMSRLINCLNGFDDNIIINISNTEQIGNIIILIKDKLISENNYTIELHKEIVIKELYDRGYTKDVIDEWIEYI